MLHHNKREIQINMSMPALDAIELNERELLYDKFASILAEDKTLSRKLVSFQANKASPIYRWFKYKEGFSSELVKYYIHKFNLTGKEVLDPFAGAGTTLFSSAELGCNATGIEILPVGIFAADVRRAVEKVDLKNLAKTVKEIWDKVDQAPPSDQFIKHIPITAGAFPEETERDLNQYLSVCATIGKEQGLILKFAAFAVLEEVSFTRKDGQYLRWDYRSNRTLGGKPFDKGRIIPFREAVSRKLSEILDDVSPLKNQTLFPEEEKGRKGEITLFEDSCLTKLNDFKAKSFDLVITSPPYCNRYDYTRTYALELVFLGADNEKVKQLRQAMLSCTVENKSKEEEMRIFYQKRNQESTFTEVMRVYHECAAMQEILTFMENFKVNGTLNNNGVVRMIRNYFLEMCFTIYELARVLNQGGKIVMVNDNVQYAGEEIPVDLILSEFAERFGLTVSNIFVLQQQKGNSSQQMGNHGRTPMRKCVYLWEKL